MPGSELTQHDVRHDAAFEQPVVRSDDSQRTGGDLVADQLARGEQGADGVGNTAADLDQTVKSELKKWAALIQQAGIKLE